MEIRESNYEVMKHRMQEKFASYKAENIAREWDLEYNNCCLVLSFVGRQYQIEMETGAVLYERDGVRREADYNVSMTLFDILTRKHQIADGTFKPVSSFSSLHSSTVTSGGLFDRTAQKFDHQDKALSGACECLGGKHYGKGDVSYRIPVFQDLEIIIQFWDSDDEFGPELNLFCDANILAFMHFETMMFMLIHVLERIMEEMQA